MLSFEVDEDEVEEQAATLAQNIKQKERAEDQIRRAKERATKLEASIEKLDVGAFKVSNPFSYFHTGKCLFSICAYFTASSEKRGRKQERSKDPKISMNICGG